MVKCSLTEFGRAGPDNKHWDDLEPKVNLSGPPIQSISTFYIIFSSFEVMLFANTPKNLQPKTHTLQKINPHFSYIRFSFQQKIADILLCLNGDDEPRYMHSIKSNWMNKKRDKKFSWLM